MNNTIFDVTNGPIRIEAVAICTIQFISLIGIKREFTIECCCCCCYVSYANTKQKYQMDLLGSNKSHTSDRNI